MPTNEKIENAFMYHPYQTSRYESLREDAKALAYEIDRLCPESREKSLAMTKLEEAIMWPVPQLLATRRPKPTTQMCSRSQREALPEEAKEDI